MELHKVLCMNGGEDEASYAKNSSHQKLVLLKAKPVLEKCIEELLHTSLPECIRVADLGCSSGPNTFLSIHEIVKSIDKTCQTINEEPPQIQVFLNDLFANDFNTIFKSLPGFYHKLEKENGREYGSCLIAAMPGSFYGKLFPDRSMHFMHSSYSLHWISQVPIDESGILLKKGNIHSGKSSPPSVQQAYLDQFTKDFTIFLRMRSQELVTHGRLLLTFMCGNDEDDGPDFLDLLGSSLNDLVLEGYVEEEKVESFNVPLCTPSVEEVRRIVEEDDCFNIQHLETFKVRHDASFPDDNQGVVYDEHVRGAHVSRDVRAVLEPILVSHFGDGIIGELFNRYAKHSAKVLKMGKGFYNNITISLAKK
nr:O-methyltransferase 4 [Hamelia patens]